MSLQDFIMHSQWSGSGGAKQVLWVCSGPGMAVLLLLLQTPLPIFLHVCFYALKFECYKKTIIVFLSTGRPLMSLNTTKRRGSWWFPVMATSSVVLRPPSVECQGLSQKRSPDTPSDFTDWERKVIYCIEIHSCDVLYSVSETGSGSTSYAEWQTLTVNLKNYRQIKRSSQFLNIFPKNIFTLTCNTETSY